jgi:hypothetical protein
MENRYPLEVEGFPLEIGTTVASNGVSLATSPCVNNNKHMFILWGDSFLDTFPS